MATCNGLFDCGVLKALHPLEVRLVVGGLVLYCRSLVSVRSMLIAEQVKRMVKIGESVKL